MMYDFKCMSKHAASHTPLLHATNFINGAAMHADCGAAAQSQHTDILSDVLLHERHSTPNWPTYAAPVVSCLLLVTH
jgi:hypothetical protein